MTAKQILKTLEKANISTKDLTISKNEIEVSVGYKEENGFGSCNDSKTKALRNKVAKVFNSNHKTMSRTGYGSWLICLNFNKCELILNNID